MRALKGLLIVLLVAIGALFGVGFSLPDAVHVERSISIRAAPSTVFAALNGYALFQKWSPWAELDPHTRYVREGPPTGVGAKLSWQSDDPNVGSGRQQIFESVPDQRIRSSLVFDGFDSDSNTSFILRPETDGTRLTWTYDASFGGNLLGRYFGLKMDDWIGADYEKGLVRLKRLLESSQTLPSDKASADAQAAE